MRYSIRVIEGDNKGEEYAIGIGDWIIGRSKNANIVLASSKVSAEHGAFFLKKSELFLRDLNSRNGIFVNGKKIIETKLSHGDAIVIGDFVFIVVQGVS